MDILECIADELHVAQTLLKGDDPRLSAIQETLEDLYEQTLRLPEELRVLGLQERTNDAQEHQDLLTWLEDVTTPEELCHAPYMTCLSSLAAVADRLAQPPFRLPGFVPSMFAVDEEGTPSANWLQLCGLGLEEGQLSLKPHQREARHVLHTSCVRQLPEELDASLPDVMLYSFALFLLGVLSTHGQRLFHVQALDRLRVLEPALPPELPVLFTEVLTLERGGQQVGGCVGFWKELTQLLTSQHVQQSTPTASVRPFKESALCSGRYKRGSMQDVELYFSDTEGELLCVGVADGISTADLGSGDMAARELARSFEVSMHQFLHTYSPDKEWPLQAEQALRASLEEANHDLVARWNLFLGERAVEDVNAPMSSTVVASMIHKDTAVIASLGDSVVWHFCGQSQRLYRLNVDHHVGNERLKDGQFDGLERPKADDAALTKFIGSGKWDPKKERFVSHPFAPDIIVRRCRPGDLLLFATDGLSGGIHLPPSGWERMVRDRLITYQEPKDLQRLAYELVTLADQDNGTDNISLVIVGFLAEEQKTITGKSPKRNKKKEKRG